MKKIVVIAAFMTVLASCGNNGNSNASNADSTNVRLPVTDSSSSGSAITPSTGNSGAATGTTGTGTVADSGNAAHPGSDTSYHTPHKELVQILIIHFFIEESERWLIGVEFFLEIFREYYR